MSTSHAMRPPPGVILILAATGIASLAGFLVLTVVPGLVGLADYKTFGLFWSAMYLIVSAISGIQQEVTRATIVRPAEPGSGPNPVRRFSVFASLAVAVAIVVSAPLWVEALFPDEGWSLVWPLAFACSSYVLVATLAGTLYGVRGWGVLALMIAVDAILRIATVLILATITTDSVVLAWAAAVPFLATIVLLWPVVRGHIVGSTTVDVSPSALTWNVARSVVASASSGVLVSGLPVVIGIAAVGEDPATVAALFVAITLTRAPVIVVVMSLHSYLIIRFRDFPALFWRTVVSLACVILGVGLVLGGAAWLFAPAVFEFLYSGEIILPGRFYAVLVVSSALVGVLSVTAPATLALGSHMVYSGGWLCAALATAACFALPLDLLSGTTIAVLVGPLAGIAFHSIYLVAARVRHTRGVTGARG